MAEATACLFDYIMSGTLRPLGDGGLMPLDA